MLGQPLDNTVEGENISKDYRDRYANFSKGAHFSFGGQGKNIKNYEKLHHSTLLSLSYSKSSPTTFTPATLTQINCLPSLLYL